MRLQVVAQAFAVRDVVKARLVLETAIVAHFTTSDPNADLSGAVKLLDVIERSSLTGYEFLAPNARFHLAFAEVLRQRDDSGDRGRPAQCG
jgi:GntR family transcriptional regulator, transcriptional repressor for pyruvate dehydrogenase complex